MSSFIGIDLGTSACRGCMIDADGTQLAMANIALPATVHHDSKATQDANHWWLAVEQVMAELCGPQSSNVAAIAVDGTSGTLLYCDAAGQPLAPALMYNDHRCTQEAEKIAALAPTVSGAHGPSSSLAKLLYLAPRHSHIPHAKALHQADWITGRLCGNHGISDEHNALKLGYDPLERRWPAWLEQLGIATEQLPRVHAPGTPVGTLRAELARRWKLPATTQIIAGTTDSTAGILATGANQVGQAITSLGSTLVVKVISPKPIFAPRYGIYSHRIGALWLAGGASNSGGAVLAHYFSIADLQRLTSRLEPHHDTGLDYYPLLNPGERFPEPDPERAPRLTPRPASDEKFLQGLLEGIANIEHQGYKVLHNLGAPYPDAVVTVGGGAQNKAWTLIRERYLGMQVSSAVHQEAAYGAALLARQHTLQKST